jgi:hypothetical protein
MPSVRTNRNNRDSERSRERKDRAPLARSGSGRLLRHGCALAQQVGVHRLGDVLEGLRAEIGDLKFEPRLHLSVGILGQANPARLADAFEPRRNVHPVTHQIAVALLHNVAEVDADTELDAPFGRQACVPLNHAALDLDSAAHRIDHAAKLDDDAVMPSPVRLTTRP